MCSRLKLYLLGSGFDGNCDSEGEILEVMPEVHVVFGGLSRDMFLRGKSLHAGSRSQVQARILSLFSDVCGERRSPYEREGYSCRGTPQPNKRWHSCWHCTRGIATAIRNPSWDRRMPIRNAAWDAGRALEGLTMGIVGHVGGTGRWSWTVGLGGLGGTGRDPTARTDSACV